MSKRPALVAAMLALTLGVVCHVLYLERFEAEASGGDRVQVLMATQDLPLGTVISQDMLGVWELPESYVENRHIPASDAQRIIGLRVSSAVASNESLLWSDLANTEQRRSLAGLVTSGMRAVSVRTDDTGSFGGLLRPGDRVDVLVTVERTRGHETATIAQNLLVLATGQDTGGQPGARTQRSERSVRQVTLRASLEQAQRLQLAQEQGRIGLVLRNPDDIEVQDGVAPDTTERLMQGAVAGGGRERLAGR